MGLNVLGYQSHRLQRCQWSRRIFPNFPGSRLMNFYRDARSALLHLVNQWLSFTYSRSHDFRTSRSTWLPTRPLGRRGYKKVYIWVLPLRTVRNSDKKGDLRETHESRNGPAAAGGARARATYGSHTGTGMVPTSPDGQSGEGSTGDPDCGWSQA